MLVFGGRSAEHHVSIRSGLAVIQNIDYLRYTVNILYLSLSGQHYCFQNINSLNKAKVFLKSYKQASEIISSNRTITHIQTLNYLRKTDVVFSLLHGRGGEDGVMQGLLESLEIAYVGSDVYSSVITMDKLCAKIILNNEGVNVTPYLSFSKYHFNIQKKGIIKRIKSSFPYPLFVKPSNYGSSIGVKKVRNDLELDQAIINVLSLDNKVIIEKAIVGKEIEVAVLEDINLMNRPTISPAGEIKVNDDFYSYKAKYIKKDAASFTIPADLNHQQNKELVMLILNSIYLT